MKNKKALAVLGASVVIAFAAGFLVGRNAPNIPDSGEAKIVVSYPPPNQAITSPLQVSGEAKGYWFFEASFPVKILDEAGSVIAQGIATAEGDWMTDEFVPFSATLEFPAQPAGSKGMLILERDNPSGLPEFDEQLGIPVKF